MLMPFVTTVILMFMPLVVVELVSVKYVTKTKLVKLLLLVMADWL
jgi:hypothetical protein